jgi:hypothetical protein
MLKKMVVVMILAVSLIFSQSVVDSTQNVKNLQMEVLKLQVEQLKKEMADFDEKKTIEKIEIKKAKTTAVTLVILGVFATAAAIIVPSVLYSDFR